MATLVYLPPGDNYRRVMGFQAGPCNLLLDGLVQRLTGGREAYDAGGKHAVQGRCIEPLMQRWLEHPCFQRRPPRSVPRQGFGEEFVAQALQQARENQWSLHDLLCTATHFVAHAITGAVRRFLPESPRRVLLSGGGVRNGLLWHLLEQQLTGITLERVDAQGVPAPARKAVAHAGLAALTLDGLPANLMSATGATGSRLLGSLTPGSSANWARCVAWMASQTAALAAA
jgi:anhydro-N-acetylmuramic acid kinase